MSQAFSGFEFLKKHRVVKETVPNPIFRQVYEMWVAVSPAPNSPAHEALVDMAAGRLNLVRPPTTVQLPEAPTLLDL